MYIYIHIYMYIYIYIYIHIYTFITHSISACSLATICLPLRRHAASSAARTWPAQNTKISLESRGVAGRHVRRP